MEPVSEKFTIQLLIGNQIHHLVVPRDNEKIFRDAAVYINEKFNQYRQRYQNQSNDKHTALTLIDLAIQILQTKENNDTQPFIDSMAKLTAEMEEVLGE
ncbi:MAG: cell division protein ZapA [Bacteroidaceae bacterium]|nr:cell division protein ZapA [Bacteroidaceae bacterium]